MNNICSPLLTDFYQLPMSVAYLYANKANDKAGFESFVRTVRKDINPEKSNYIFQGYENVVDFMEKVKKDLNDPRFFNIFWNIVSKSIPNANGIKELIEQRFNEMSKDFLYSVIPNGTIVRPLVPVFQFYGPLMIGQLIETNVNNMINGQTGLRTYKEYGIDKNIINDLENMVYPKSYPMIEPYISQVEEKAREFRNSTKKPIMEAGYRRAPSYEFSISAAVACLKAGFNGTSNVSAYLEGKVSLEAIGGTMGHAFVMSFKTELEAFKLWNEVYPKSCILLDTYDTINAVNLLIENDIRPAMVRIDSEPLDILSFKVREILDNAGWNEVKIFISGDLTPEIIEDFENRKVPFDLTMVGTKVVNVNLGRFINSGFVYKIVQIETNGEMLYPEKKAFGKANYPGLKTISVVDSVVKMEIFPDRFGYGNVSDIKEESVVEFKRAS